MDICNEMQELLSSYVDDELSQEELERVNEHLADCESCAKELALLREVTSKVKDLPEPDFPPELHRKLMEKTREQSGRRTRQARIPFRSYAAMAAGVLLMFTALSFIALLPVSVSQKQSGLAEMASGTGSAEDTGLMFSLRSEEAEYADAAMAVPEAQNDRSLILVSDAVAGAVEADQTDELMVRSYNIELLVEDFESALNMIDNLPGYNVRSEIVNRGSESWAWVSRRVDDGSYNMTKVVLQSMGKVTSANESLERITAENIDLEARLAAKQEEADRLLSLLESSKTMNVLAMVESRLGQVENEIDGLKGQLNLYADQSSRPAVHITLRAVSNTVVEREGFGDRVRKAYASSVNGTLRFMEIFLIVLSFISVPAAIVILVFLCLWSIYRRKKLRKRRRTDERET